MSTFKKNDLVYKRNHPKGYWKIVEVVEKDIGRLGCPINEYVIEPICMFDFTCFNKQPDKMKVSWHSISKVDDIEDQFNNINKCFQATKGI